MIGQIRADRKQSGRELGVGGRGEGGLSWKVLESGFELGMPVAQWHCMSAYAAHSAIGADMKYIFKVAWQNI